MTLHKVLTMMKLRNRLATVVDHGLHGESAFAGARARRFVGGLLHADGRPADDQNRAHAIRARHCRRVRLRSPSVNAPARPVTYNCHLFGTCGLIPAAGTDCPSPIPLGQRSHPARLRRRIIEPIRRFNLIQHGLHPDQISSLTAPLTGMRSAASTSPV